MKKRLILKIRVIFSVNKLNEGWDVLNLFDIVKLYKTQNKTETIREAQLIGRGARYCPFDFEDKLRSQILKNIITDLCVRKDKEQVNDLLLFVSGL